MADAGPAPALGAGNGGWTGPATRRSAALLRGCRSARDRLVVLLMARAGLRRGEVCGLRRSECTCCRIHGRWVPGGGAHLHVVRRDNPNGAWAKSRRQRTVPPDFLVVWAFDAYEFERMESRRRPAATSCW